MSLPLETFLKRTFSALPSLPTLLLSLSYYILSSSSSTPYLDLSAIVTFYKSIYLLHVVLALFFSARAANAAKFATNLESYKLQVCSPPWYYDSSTAECSRQRNTGTHFPVPCPPALAVFVWKEALSMTSLNFIGTNTCFWFLWNESICLPHSSNEMKAGLYFYSFLFYYSRRS